MVRKMVWLVGMLITLSTELGAITYAERGTVGNADGQVRCDCKCSVRCPRLEREIVRDFMNGEEEVLVGGSPDNVGGENEWQGEHRCVAEQHCATDLDGHDKKTKVLGQRLWAAELEDLSQLLAYIPHTL